VTSVSITWKKIMGSWVAQMEVWLTAAFPAVRFKILNLARGSTDELQHPHAGE
jgi:hypothetical protein